MFNHIENVITGLNKQLQKMYYIYKQLIHKTMQTITEIQK